MNRFASEKTQKGIFRKILPLIAAIGAIILLMISLPFSTESEPNKYQRLEKEYQTSPTLETLTSDSTRTDSMMQIGITHFQSTNYQAARDHFKHVPTTEKTQLYIAHTYFQEEQPSMASGFYKALVFSSDPSIRDEAQWYWVQCNLKELPTKHTELISGLRLITNTAGDHKYKESANLLLNEFLY